MRRQRGDRWLLRRLALTLTLTLALALTLTLTVAPLLKQMPPYVPDFTKAFEFICVHTGGRTLTRTLSLTLSLTLNPNPKP